MPPAPTVDPLLIKATIERLTVDGVQPSSTVVAKALSEELGKPVRPGLVRSTLLRYRDEWNLQSASAPKSMPAMQYRIAERLGPVALPDTKAWHWQVLTAKERADAGLTDPEGKLAREGLRLGEDLTHFGDVVDYDPERAKPFFVRPAWPWELGDYLKAPEPEDVQTVLREALSTPEGEVVGVDGKTYTITPDHRSAWTKRLLEATEELG